MNKIISNIDCDSLNDKLKQSRKFITLTTKLVYIIMTAKELNYEAKKNIYMDI